jgi:hypothetical protein
MSAIATIRRLSRRQIDPGQNRLVDLITKDPAWFRRLSVAQREEVNYSLWAEGRLKIEPWRIRDETIKLWPRSQVAGCIEQPDGALTVKLESGETIVVDQVIAATGYKVDIARVPFLAAGNLLGNLIVRNGFPKLDVHFHWTVLGLHQITSRCRSPVPGTTSSGFAMKRSSFSLSHTKSAPFMALE